MALQSARCRLFSSSLGVFFSVGPRRGQYTMRHLSQFSHLASASSFSKCCFSSSSVGRESSERFSELVLPISMKTKVPGPQSQRLKAEYDVIGGGGGTLSMFVDFNKSLGNYMVDADDNRMLDMFGHIASIPVGYNHPALLSLAETPSMKSLLTHRAALGLLPPTDFGRKMIDVVMGAAPPGMTHVIPMACGSCANENAFKAACAVHAMRQREKQGRTAWDYTNEELESVMMNSPPGSPNVSIMSFLGGFHGRTLGSLSCTRSRTIHKVDVPAFDWPAAPFPRLKYPLGVNERANETEERRCLDAVEEVIVSKSKTSPVAALIVEPIQSEGGDHHASPQFFRKLREITRRHSVAFIVDEVQTGLWSTGYMWAHEAWQLDDPPDIVTFSKKCQLAGFYYRSEYQPDRGYRIFNTWMGDATRLLQFETILNVVKEERLDEVVNATGSALIDLLREAEQQQPNLLHSARGQGTFCAIDAVNARVRDHIVEAAKQKGLMIGVSGDTAIRFRPPLTAGKKHVEQMRPILMDAIAAAAS